MSLSLDITFVSLDIIIVTRLAPVQTGLAEIPICSRSLQFMANMKQTIHCSFGHVWSSYPRLTSEARSLFAKCHLAVHPPRQVKLYLIKMLCSLPNSSPHIWFPLFVFCGWARTSTPLNQSLLKRENIWVTFLHLVWYDKAAAAPVRTG